jgi:glucuronokinase
MRALMQFFDVNISNPVLANVVLSVEVEELGIDAGLQDRVAQVYETPVFMDFDKELMAARGYGDYQSLDLTAMPNFFIAYRTDLAEGSEVIHGHLREKYNQGDPEVLDAMTRWSELTDRAGTALQQGDFKLLGELMDRNFDLRCKVCSNVSPKNREMVNIARSVGANAKFTGSGGAIIGLYKDEAMWKKLAERFSEKGIGCLIPTVVNGTQ